MNLLARLQRWYQRQRALAAISATGYRHGLWTRELERGNPDALAVLDEIEGAWERLILAVCDATPEEARMERNLLKASRGGFAREQRWSPGDLL